MAVKGYKVFNPDWTCRGFQYEVGKIYEEDVKPKVCERGFHFCKLAKDCFNYYDFDPKNKVAEVLALGKVVEKSNKCCTDKIHIVREITWEEVLTLVNIGEGNTGLRNTGNCNSGDCNTGNFNTGNFNTGDRNTGHDNTGNCNTGDRNTGHDNTGICNTGVGNTGNFNTGNLNKGNFCTGDFNISDHETGCFCTKEHTIRFFDKESDMTLSEWRYSKAYHLLQRILITSTSTRWIYSQEMTDQEKEIHPEHVITGGYLRVYEPNPIFPHLWKLLSKREKEIIKSIPNFDAEKFAIITGIKVTD